MDSKIIIGQAVFKAKHIPSSVVVESIVSFEDGKEVVYYCWKFQDLSGSLIANKCLPISKRVINEDIFDYAIKHCEKSINNYRISRKNVFEVLEIKKIKS